MHDWRVEIWNWLILRLLNQQKLLFEIIIQDRDFQKFFAGRFVRRPAMVQKGIERAGWHLRAFAFDFEMAHKPNSSKSWLFLNWLIFKPSKNFVTGKLCHLKISIKWLQQPQFQFAITQNKSLKPQQFKLQFHFWISDEITDNRVRWPDR